MIPELVTIHTSLLTDLGDAVRERFGVSGEKTLTELKEIIEPSWNIPDEYQKVDYIQCSGTQGIDTGVVDEGDIEIDSSFMWVSGSTEAALFSTWTSAYGYWNLFISSGRKINFYFSGHHEMAALEANRLYSISLVRNSSYNSVAVLTSPTHPASGTTGTSFVYTAHTNPTTIKLLIRGDMNIGTYTIKLYNTEIKKNGTVVRRLAPCYRKSDKVIGMYDIANNQFYTNAGSDSFTCYPAPPSN